MPLKVIGAGFGRTGTMSLKIALEQLGFGPCYHMVEVFQNPRAPLYWSAAADGKPVDWEEVFAGYVSTVDFPGCAFYREIADRYPEAKVILTLRESGAWFESARATIFNPANFEKLDGMPNMAEMLQKVAFQRTFKGQEITRENAIPVYEAHNAEVQRTIPRERLLVYDVAQGWEPLCAFLGVAVPDGPFPRLNTRENFGHMAADLTQGRYHGGEGQR